MAEEILRLPPGTLKGWSKQGGIEVIAPKAPERSSGGNLAELKQLFGNNFIGPDDIENAFGIRINPPEVPTVPFAPDELQRAKDLDQVLILRVDKAPDGSPLTMLKMQQMLQGKFDAASKGKVLYDISWYKDEDFFKKDIPRAGWALVSKELVPDTTNINYLQQTRALATYLQTQVFKGGTIPQKYQEAIQEFDGQEQQITGIISSKWREAATKLSRLKLNQLTRQTPTEVVYDLLAYFEATGERLLPDKVAWTNRQTSGGRLVRAGSFDSKGLTLLSWRPDNQNPDVGVCLSR